MKHLNFYDNLSWIIINNQTNIRNNVFRYYVQHTKTHTKRRETTEIKLNLNGQNYDNDDGHHHDFGAGNINFFFSFESAFLNWNSIHVFFCCWINVYKGSPSWNFTFMGCWNALMVYYLVFIKKREMIEEREKKRKKCLICRVIMAMHKP